MFPRPIHPSPVYLLLFFLSTLVSLLSRATSSLLSISQSLHFIHFSPFFSLISLHFSPFLSISLYFSQFLSISFCVFHLFPSLSISVQDENVVGITSEDLPPGWALIPNDGDPYYWHAETEGACVRVSPRACLGHACMHL